MPKKAAVERFPAMSDSLRSIRQNKETFSVDLLVDTRAGSRWGIVFFGLKSKLLAYYRLGKKEPTSHSTLDALRKFIAWHGIPKKIITDSDFPAMSDSLRSIRRNKETFSVDLLVDTRAGSRWGIVFFWFTKQTVSLLQVRQERAH